MEKGEILYYNRHLNDCILIIRKGTEIRIQEVMNSYDYHLKFTFENFVSNKLPFSDTCIYLDTEKFYNSNFTENQRHAAASEVKMNFKKWVGTVKYKISSLTGEIYRAVNWTSTIKDREDAIGQITNF